MSVPYLGADAITLQEVSAALPLMPAFLDFTGASTAPEAAGLVIEIEGEILTVAHACIDTPVLRFNRTPGGGHEGTADVLILFAFPLTDNDTDAEAHRRALGHVAALRLGLIEAFGQRLLSIVPEPPVILDVSEALPAFVEFSFALTLEVSP